VRNAPRFTNVFSMRKFTQSVILLSGLAVLSNAAYAQKKDSIDASKYSKRNVQQQQQYQSGDYLFPAKPKDNIGIAFKLGLAALSGDVRVQPGNVLGLTVRKSLGHVFSLRAEATTGVMKGLNYSSSRGYYNHGAYNPFNYYYGSGGTNLDISPIARPDNGYNQPNGAVYYNYRTRFIDASIQGIINLNNINFYKRDVKWNMYGGAGVGTMLYLTKVNALDDRGDQNRITTPALYNFEALSKGLPSLNNVTIFKYNSVRSQRIDAIKGMFDDTYESRAEYARGGGVFRFKKNTGDPYTVAPLLTALAGVRFKVSRRIDVEGEYRASWTANDLLDGQQWSEQGYPNSTAFTRDFDNYGLITIGVQYRLGKGEESAWWRNPLEESYKKQVDTKLMVDKMQDDTDGDGIPDLFDKEPDTQKGIAVDPSGRALDADGDGVKDSNDDEPFSPKGAKVDARGRAIDKDGDGVPDIYDKQDQTPKSGEFVDARGMIVSVPQNVNETQVRNIATQVFNEMNKGGSGGCMLPMIHFDLDKDFIKTDFYPELYYISQVMKNDPSLKVRAFGHTDVRASDSYNEDLAKRRVKNAIDFLVNTYGIDRARFITDSFGEKKNLVANLPATHNPKLEPMQYLNRRVEFECVRGGK